MYLLDYAFYLPLGLALKLGLHPLVIAHLSAGTTSSLLGSHTPTGGSTDVGRGSPNAIHFCPMFYVCVMDKRNHFNFIFLKESPFFYCLDQIFVHLLVSQIPAGGSKEVGREYMNAIYFRPMFYRWIMDKRNHFYLVLFKENPFFYCLDQILVHLLDVLDG
jgi:hypothetical protein